MQKTKIFYPLIFVFIYFSQALAVNENWSLGPNEKVYINSNDVEIGQNGIYINHMKSWLYSDVIRKDELGFFLLENEMQMLQNAREEYWKCPYCFRWWKIGEKCQEPQCPTNRW